jgi:DNA adenine methylase
MQQAELFDENFLMGPVNVASVPKLSPFRYPGGKTWFVPYARRWLSLATRQKYNFTPVRPERYIEPFLGGGSISLMVAFELPMRDIITVEINADISSVWQTILNAEDGEWLANKILAYNLTTENVQATLDNNPVTIRERAFKTIVRNRVNRGGILAPGAGLLKAGENGRGLSSRWYPQTLARRIRHITSIHNRIVFMHDDGMHVLANYRDDPDAVFFIDPPYTAGKNGKRAGRRLYTHNEVDHEQLFDYVSHLRGDFLITYDDAEEVRALARHHNLDTRLIPMKNTHHAKMTELLIGRNLDWVSAVGHASLTE